MNPRPEGQRVPPCYVWRRRPDTLGAVTVRICDERGEAGFSWIAEEPLTRTSHVLAADGSTWIVDPVDDPEAIERAAALGTPRAVLQLLDRHTRDAPAVAARLGVPHVVVPRALPGTPFEAFDIRRRRWWKEVGLWWPAERLLLVPEAIGTTRFVTAGRGPAGMHLFDRILPGRDVLSRFEPEHLLVGHGEGVHGPAAAAALRVLPSLRG